MPAGWMPVGPAEAFSTQKSRNYETKPFQL